MISVDPKTFVVGTLAADAFVAVNKKVIRFFDGDATLAVVLCELISIYKYQLAIRAVDKLDAFPLPIVFLEKTLGLSAYKQQHAISRLQADNMLIAAVYGKPASRWITLNFQAIAQLIEGVELYDANSAEEKKSFYDKINEAANSLSFYEGDISSLVNALDNIREPLRGCMLYISRRFIQEGVACRWTSEAVGVLKQVIRQLQKSEVNFDYGKFIDVLKLCFHSSSSIAQLAKDMLSKWKLVADRAPSQRIYSSEVLFES